MIFQFTLNDYKGISDNPLPVPLFVEQASGYENLLESNVPKINLILAEIVKWFHVGIVIYTGIGWIFPWTITLQFFLILVPVMKLHWMTNNDICIFTTLENKLRRNPNAGTSDQEGFIYRLSKIIFGKYSPSEEFVTTFSEYFMYVGWVIAALRLYVL